MTDCHRIHVRECVHHLCRDRHLSSDNQYLTVPTIYLLNNFRRIMPLSDQRPGTTTVRQGLAGPLVFEAPRFDLRAKGSRKP